MAFALRSCTGSMLLFSLLALLSWAPSAAAFYLPGAAPRDYVLGEKVPVHVNRLNPLVGAQDARLKSMINYDYYNPAFHFCQPEGGPKRQPESLGSILFGDRIFDSPYDIKMLQNSTCHTLCKSTVPPEDAKFINDRIKEDQAINWLVDGLPAAEMKKDEKSDTIFYDIGFNLGNDEGQYTDIPALYNHYDVLIHFHTQNGENFRVVAVLVWPRSIDNSGKTSPSCSGEKALILNEKESNEFSYTYSVSWQESSTPWATRWDNYLHLFDERIHWFSLVNSVVIVVFLCAMVSMILWRTVARDIDRYNAMDLSEDVQEDFGWKLVHGEVFRPPRWPTALSVVVGNGAQLIAMTGVTLVFALFGFLSPSNRGSLATVMIIFWTFSGGIGGYVSARLYASLSPSGEWRRNTFFTATVLPTFIFGFMFLINLFLIGTESAGAIPFGTILVVLLLWVLISIPLCIVGSIMGQRHGSIGHPVRVNQIPRQIPPGPKYLKPHWASLLGGILPFGAAFVEMFFMLSSLFASRAYYAFGFVALTAGVMGLTTATVTILFTYFILCAEEYRWQWRALLVGGGSAAWLYLYGIYYYMTQLQLSFVSTVVYFGYLSLLALLDFLVTGTIGFIASYWAIRKLYSAIRID